RFGLEKGLWPTHVWDGFSLKNIAQGPLLFQNTAGGWRGESLKTDPDDPVFDPAAAIRPPEDYFTQVNAVLQFTAQHCNRHRLLVILLQGRSHVRRVNQEQAIGLRHLFAGQFAEHWEGQAGPAIKMLEHAGPGRRGAGFAS